MVRAAALGLLLAATPIYAQAKQSYFETWDANRERFEAQGFDRTTWLLSAVYFELRYIGGYCSAYLSDDALVPIDIPGHSELQARLHRESSQTFRDGLRDGAAEMPSANQCDQLLRNHIAEADSIYRDLAAEREGSEP